MSAEKADTTALVWAGPLHPGRLEESGSHGERKPEKRHESQSPSSCSRPR